MSYFHWKSNLSATLWAERQYLVVIWIRLLLLFLHILTSWAEPLIIMIGSCLMLYLGGNHKMKLTRTSFYTLWSRYMQSFLSAKFAYIVLFIEPIHQIIIIFYSILFYSISIRYMNDLLFGLYYLIITRSSCVTMAVFLPFVHIYQNF